MSSKKKVDVTVLLAALSDYNIHQNEKGYVADCPVCEDEREGKGSNKLLLDSEGRMSCMTFAGHDFEMRKKHRDEIIEALGVNETATFTNHKLPDNFILKVSKATTRGKHQIALFDSEE